MAYSNLLNAIKVIEKLRDPQNGCPWDLEQTHESLIKYLIEESYELIQSIEENNTQAMEEELGDVLLQVLLHSQIASEKGHFTIDSVAKNLADKMIERHPHVFQDKSLASTPEEVTANWHKIKEKKKADKKFHITMEDAYAPSLSAADKIGAKSQAINFDWDNIEDVIKKVDEELAEVKAEVKTMQSKENIQEEIGDLLFSVAQLARHLDIDPELALKQANMKFVKRINLVQKEVMSQNNKMSDLPTQELEKVWQKVKKDLKNSNNSY